MITPADARQVLDDMGKRLGVLHWPALAKLADALDRWEEAEAAADRAAELLGEAHNELEALRASMCGPCAAAWEEEVA